MTEPYGAIVISTDAQMLVHESDAALRMREYAALYGQVHVMVCADVVSGEPIELGKSVRMYPVAGRPRALGIVRTAVAVRRLIKQTGARVIIAQDAFAFGFVAWLLARLAGIRCVVGIYGTDPFNEFFKRESLKHRLYAVAARFVLAQADAVQTDSPETVDVLRARYGEKVFFKPMFPANQGEFGAVSHSLPPSPLRVLFIARFVAQKNLPLLLGVMQAAKEKMGTQIRFSIAGGGPMKNWFLQEITRRELGDVCADLGMLSREEIPQAYASHHLLLLTSYYEGFPRVFMEAALSGLPVVTSRVGGIKDLIIDGESGYMLEQGAPATEYAERLAHLREHPEVLKKFSQAIGANFRKAYGGKTILDYQRPLFDFVRDLDAQIIRDALLVARNRAFWTTQEARDLFPRRILIPAHAGPVTYGLYLARIMFELLRKRPRLLVLGTTMPYAKLYAAARRRGWLRGLPCVTDHQFLSSGDAAMFAAVWAYSRQEILLRDEGARSRFVFLRYPSKLPLAAPSNPAAGRYIFAGGNHKRDFHSFIKAVKDIPVQVRIVTDNTGAVSPSENVSVRGRMPLSDYINEMAGALFVVVPLQEGKVPHGHCDLSIAVSLGKAVISTRGAGVDDYVEDGASGLLVEPGDVAGYRAAVERLLGDGALRASCEARARELAPLFSYGQFARDLGKLCLTVVQSSSRKV